MSMRDYRNLPWQNQQPLGRNPNLYRSMRDYRNQWMSAPLCSVPPTYAPPPHPQYASLSQPQPPQPISPVEQAILDLTKLVGDVVEEQNKFNAQLSQRIHTMENSLEQKLDGLQSGIDHKIDNLQTSISRLTLQSIPKNLDPKATAKPKAQFTPAAQFTPEAPNGNVTPFALPWLHNFRKLVAIAQTFATTSKKMAAADVAWHSGWFGCWFGFGAPEPRHC